MSNENREIISIHRSHGNNICNGCGGYTPEGEPTGNFDLKHFALHFGNTAHVVTYCQECAAKVAQFLLQAWEE